MYSGEIPDGNYNLKGLSFTNSTYTSFAHMVLNSQHGDLGMWFMADNMFMAQNVGGNVQWISTDGEKMENSHHPKDVDAYIQFIRS